MLLYQICLNPVSIGSLTLQPAQLEWLCMTGRRQHVPAQRQKTAHEDMMIGCKYSRMNKHDSFASGFWKAMDLT